MENGNDEGGKAEGLWQNWEESLQFATRTVSLSIFEHWPSLKNFTGSLHNIKILNMLQR